MAAALFDFGVWFFLNARELVDRGAGPYVYLPKLESHAEAALWHDVFSFSEDVVGLPRGSIRATVLIETILAAFEMDEILHALGEHATALNAGRWDYIFSVIKELGGRPEFLLPDRAQVTMAVPFMRAYADLLVKTCHRRGAHAIGGMAAFIPSRRDPSVNEIALANVRDDKEREREPASTVPGSHTPISCRSRRRSSTASSARRRTSSGEPGTTWVSPPGTCSTCTCRVVPSRPTGSTRTRWSASDT